MTLAAVSNYIDALTLNLGTSTSAQAGPLAGTLTLGPGWSIITANFSIANNKSSFTVAGSGGGGLQSPWCERGGYRSFHDHHWQPQSDRHRRCWAPESPQRVPGGHQGIDANDPVANPNTGTTTGDTGTGILQFDTGTVDATTILMANSATPSRRSCQRHDFRWRERDAARRLGRNFIGHQTTNGVATGTLTVASGGTLACLGNITDGTVAGTGTLNISGTLNMGLETHIGAAGLHSQQLYPGHWRDLGSCLSVRRRDNVIGDTSTSSPDSGLTINALPGSNT